jgi:hypothetical protein
MMSVAERKVVNAPGSASSIKATILCEATNR